MPTPTVVPRSGDTAGKTCLAALAVVNVVVLVGLAPDAFRASAVTV